ncbi:MAG: nitrite reductase [Magnetococcales bacterium]|nr:nitrite reductase [Magnetococcales bacterium]
MISGNRSRTLIAVAGLLVVAVLLGWGLVPSLFEQYTGVVNAPLSFDSSRPVTEREFELLADELTRNDRMEKAQAITAGEEQPFARRIKTDLLMRTRSFQQGHRFDHIDYFRKAGIRQYQGPSTCLQCHARMKVPNGQGGQGYREVDTMADVLDTVHFKFQQTSTGLTTFGYDGREVNAPGDRPIPVGKIDRACGIPGSFSWTGWAALVESQPGTEQGSGGQPVAATLRSEGCGQCHIGGNYHPATEAMMPGLRIPEEARQGIDCLICHARGYDMNERYVIQDRHGLRWNQDRSMRAAMTVGMPTVDNCLFCHQHNLGGDTFAGNVSAKNLGHQNPRLLHAGAKRATPFSADKDVHAAAGLHCLDCHVPQGHKIPRGTKGTDLVANDLPGREVSCEQCHTAAPHTKGDERALLNGHVDRVACETCHIRELEESSVVLRDWLHPVWNEEEGVYTYRDIYQSGKPGKGLVFLWFNGYGTFLANALGDHPLGGGHYNPLMEQMVKLDDPEVVEAVRRQAMAIKDKDASFDVERYVREATQPLTALSDEMLQQRRQIIEDKLRPIMQRGRSKIYPFKIFNALMYEDMSNQGPFGAMILPFDYPVYYRSGDPLASMKKAIAHPIVKRMYQQPFKLYMMDEFMKYFGVPQWSGQYPLQDNGQLRQVEGHWMRQMGTLMVNHSIERQGRACLRCHGKKGIIDFERLGYPPERVSELRNLPELK